nr:reverse transcriptase domain-containing protein [Tanacetum cinerariifolium]
MHLERHGEQIKTIQNHLDELPLERIEEIEDKIRGLGSPTIKYKESSGCDPRAQEQQVNTTTNPTRLDTLFSRSNCTEDCKVKFATSTLTDEALSWWNSFAQPIRIEEAYKITWPEFKKLLIKKYYPRTEVKKMEDEFYNLAVKGNDLKTYVRRF